MRRARIKVMATVPARRKPAQNVNNDIPETTKAPAIEIDNDRTDLSTKSSTENSEQSVVTTAPLNATINNVDIKVKPPKIEPPKVDPPVSEAKHETIEKIPQNLPKNPEEPPEVTIEKSLSPQKPVGILDTNQGSESEDTKTASTNIDTPPVTKISQTRTSFMRPTPRLDGGGRMRRNSIQGSGASASESEDDTRRSTTVISTRVRNDSVVSVNNPKGRPQINSTGVNASPVETEIDGDALMAQHTLLSTGRRKRKVIVSESARKLTEAKREFSLRHENKQPDKSKLIMYDLIYYNPATNPMKKSDNPTSQRTSSSVITADTEDYEEDEDEPAEAMPVPQVKVGPDGSLVIDEQSLVIEHTGAKKNRQAMARTEALVDEDGNGSGFYKKRQKSKDWSKWETLKFYKALNNVGTDFLLMQSLFPKRSRREIKLKFKKEERNNPRLLEKALTYHQEFDIESLKEDLATFEETVRKRSELDKPKDRPTAGLRGIKRRNNKSRRMTAASISELNPSFEAPECSPNTSCDDKESQESPLNGEQKKSRQRRTVQIDIPSRSESTSSEESASDTEIYQVKPTRSGRTPKVRKLQAPTIDNVENTDSDDDEDDDGNHTSQHSPTMDMISGNKRIDETETENERTTIAETHSDEDKPSWKAQHFPESLSGISQVEPGSLVIVSRESADDPGETVLQVYMVSSDIDGHGKGLKQNMTPVVLTPELLNTVTAGITKVAPINISPD